MIFIKSLLAGLAALIVAISAIYAIAIVVPRVLELMPPGQGGIGVYEVGPFPLWPLGAGALLTFAGGFYWSFRAGRH
jgi:hypothetical protein